MKTTVHAIVRHPVSKRVNGCPCMEECVFKTESLRMRCKIFNLALAFTMLNCTERIWFRLQVLSSAGLDPNIAVFTSLLKSALRKLQRKSESISFRKEKQEDRTTKEEYAQLGRMISLSATLRTRHKHLLSQSRSLSVSGEGIAPLFRRRKY
jgi:hypothetical protein